MADLTNKEKFLFEKLFGMSTGYVLNFSNNSMREFVYTSVGIDIQSEEYNYHSGSKANRLRAFWNQEPNTIVAKLLLDLLEYWQEKGESSFNEITTEERTLYEECLNIANRLSLDTINSSPLIINTRPATDILTSLVPTDAGLGGQINEREAEESRYYFPTLQVARFNLSYSVIHSSLRRYVLRAGIKSFEIKYQRLDETAGMWLFINQEMTSHLYISFVTASQTELQLVVSRPTLNTTLLDELILFFQSFKEWVQTDIEVPDSDGFNTSSERPTGGFSLGQNANTGDITVGAIAGRDVNNTYNVHLKTDSTKNDLRFSACFELCVTAQKLLLEFRKIRESIPYSLNDPKNLQDENSLTNVINRVRALNEKLHEQSITVRLLIREDEELMELISYANSIIGKQVASAFTLSNILVYSSEYERIGNSFNNPMEQQIKDLREALYLSEANQSSATMSFITEDIVNILINYTNVF